MPFFLMAFFSLEFGFRAEAQQFVSGCSGCGNSRWNGSGGQLCNNTYRKGGVGLGCAFTGASTVTAMLDIDGSVRFRALNSSTQNTMLVMDGSGFLSHRAYPIVATTTNGIPRFDGAGLLTTGSLSDNGTLLSTASGTAIRFNGLASSSGNVPLLIDGSGNVTRSSVALNPDALGGATRFQGLTFNRITAWNGSALVNSPMTINGNNVGVGVSAPQESLELSGALRLGTNASNQSGTIRWNSTTSDFEGYDGTNWVSLTDTGAAFPTPWNGTTDISYSGGNVGIGTSTPTSQLHTTGAVRFAGISTATESVGVMIDGAGKLSTRALDPVAFNGFTESDPKVASTTSGQVPNWDGSNLVDGNITDIGNVGIGTTNPQEALDVAGGVRIGNSTNTNAGTMRYNPVTMNFEGYNGTGWVNLSDTSSAADSITCDLPLSTSDTVLVCDTNGLGKRALDPIAFNGFTEVDPQVSSSASGKVPVYNGTTLVDGSITDVGGNVGVGTTNPTANFQVTGSIKFIGLPNINSDSVLVCDTNGIIGKRSLSAITEVDPQVGSNTTDFVPKWDGSALVKGIIYDDDSIGIGTSNPQTLVHVKDGGFLAEGANGTVPPLGPGTRMMWMPNEKAFRAGEVNQSQWDGPNVGDHSVAFGQNNTASGNFSAAVGQGNTASGAGSFVSGSGNTASGPFSIAMGQNNGASFQNTVAIGQNAIANSLNSIAIGQNVVASGQNAIVLGSNANATSNNAFATGNMTNATGFNSTAMGFNTTAVGNTATAMGTNTSASAPSATAMGAGTNANGDFCTATGLATTASIHASFAANENTMAIGTNTSAFGFGTLANQYAAFAMGRTTQATGQVALATGNNTIASGTHATTFGDSTRASGVNAIATGNRTLASGTNAVTFGDTTNATALNSFAAGRNVTASAWTSHIFGAGGLNNTIANSFWIGYNTTGGTPTFFVGPTGAPPAGAPTPPAEGVGIGTTTPGFALDVVSGQAAKPGGGPWLATSDRRLKTNIEDYDQGVDALMKFRPVTYHYNEESGLPTDRRFVGLVAQEVQEVAPDMVVPYSGGEGQDYLAVDPNELTYMLVNATREQQEVIDSIETGNQELLDELEDLKNDLQDQAAENAELKNDLDEMRALLSDMKIALEEVCNNGCDNISNRKAGEQTEGTAALFQNMPNPFRQNTTIRYYLPEGSTKASITVYDLKGTALNSFELPVVSGYGSIEISGQMLPVGQYLYTLVVDGREIDTKKMILTQ